MLPHPRSGGARHGLTVLAILGCLALSACGVATSRGGSAEQIALDSIVKIVVGCSYPDLASPWQKRPMDQVSGSGAIIADHRILTNAHVVVYAVDIQVSRHGDPEMYAARVLSIDHERDLALLTVDDPAFFEHATPLELGPLPKLQSPVEVCGYPLGGKSLSVTEGVLSRIETDLYSHSFRENLLLQLDAPMNSGNSGGPVLSDGRLIGLAMQVLEEAENIGYCIPSPVIEQFFQDCEDGVISGPPSLGVLLQPMMSPALRQALHMSKGTSGGLVNWVLPGTPAEGALEVDDVILRIDGHDVANDLTVDLKPYGRLDCGYLVTRKQVGDSMAVTVWRDGKRREVQIGLENVPDLVPGPQHDDRPEYLICGGLVLAPFDIAYLFLFDEFPDNLASAAFAYNERTDDRRQAVVLVRVLPHPINKGYHELEDILLTEAMGERVRDFAHLKQLLDDPAGDWIDLRFDDHTRVMLPVSELQHANAEIMKRYNVHEAQVSLNARSEE